MIINLKCIALSPALWIVAIHSICLACHQVGVRMVHRGHTEPLASNKNIDCDNRDEAVLNTCYSPGYQEQFSSPCP